jgi:hypothetical protein
MPCATSETGAPARRCSRKSTPTATPVATAASRGSEGKSPHAFVPLTFELGEAFQFDWSEEGLVVGGIYRRMQVSHLRLCASRAF